jgi:hypothetical protein
MDFFLDRNYRDPTSLPNTTGFNIIMTMARYLICVLLLSAIFPSAGKAQTNSSISLGGQKLPAGAYQGVYPGSPNPPAVKVAPGATPIQATWLGFQPLADGRSRFFVQLTSRAEMQIDSSHSGQLIVVLQHVRVAGRNNRRPLETERFNTPVKRAYLHQNKKDTEIIFELRSAAIPVITNQPGADGFCFIIFDFPAGSYLSAATQETPPIRTQ